MAKPDRNAQQEMPLAGVPPRGLSLRSFMLGLFLVVIIAVLTPPNDYVRKNTYMIGSQLPLTLVFFISAMALAINPMLKLYADGRRAGRWAAGGVLALGVVLLLGAGVLGALWVGAQVLELNSARNTLAAWSRAWAQTDFSILAVACALTGFFLVFLSPMSNGQMRRGMLRIEELALAVAMLFVACAVPSSGLLRFALAHPAQAVYFTNENPWFADYLKLLPGWLFPSRNPNSKILVDFYLGLSGRNNDSLLGTWIPWLLPYLMWGVFIGAMFTAAIFLAALMRRQWVQHERLAFPLATVPLEMMQPPKEGLWSDLWRNRLLWGAAAIPILFHLTGGIAKFFPNFPALPVKYDFTSSFTEFPWSVLAPSVKSATLYFSMVGIFYFVPLEILFSIWFFFIVYQLGTVMVNAGGTPVLADNQTYQAIGITLTYGIFFVWISRHHFRRILLAAWRGTPREPDEVVSYRWGMIVLLGAIIVAAAWLVWVVHSQMAHPSGLHAFSGFAWLQSAMHLAMNWIWTSLWALALVVLLLYFMLLLTRIAIEAGVPFIYLPYGADPIAIFSWAFRGTHVLSKSQWLMNSWGSWLILADQRENIMPFAADALRVGQVAPGKSRRRFLGALLLAVLLSMILGQASTHMVNYSYGRGSMEPWMSHNSTVYVIMNPARTNAETAPTTSTVNPGRNFFYGALMMGVVGASRLMFTGSPFHPVGLLLLNSGAIPNIWFSIFVAWILKAAIMRFGGAKTFQVMRPAFIGLIVGDALIGVMWIGVGYFVHWPGGSYQILPG